MTDDTDETEAKVAALGEDSMDSKGAGEVTLLAPWLPEANWEGDAADVEEAMMAGAVGIEEGLPNLDSGELPSAEGEASTESEAVGNTDAEAGVPDAELAGAVIVVLLLV
jgi:hypothetical protein